jgi:acyl-CoA synthetase (AMP-forming)/AMP-acid ligase II
VTRDNFGDLFWKAAALTPEKVALEQGHRTVTYGELEERTQRAAGLLRRLGVGPGDKVFLLLPNDYRLPECFFGALRAGAVVVPANIRLGAETLVYIASHSDSVVMIAHAELREKAERVLAEVPAIRHALIMDGAMSGAEPYDERLAQSPPGFATIPADPNGPALLMYTSGSTGRPKGCLLSHASQWWQARSSVRTLLLDEEDKALVMGPLYHANALWVCLLPMLYVGGSLAILPGFDPPAVLAAIDRYRPTYTSGTPSMFSLLLAQREALARYDVSSMRLMLCGSAPVPDELMTALYERFHCEVVEGYGLTEGGANVESPRWGIRKLGSAGLPVPDVEIRVVGIDDPSRECRPGEVGELWTRSPANAIGYYKQPDVTAERFTSDGWLRTGDLVRRDDQGYLYICGRKDDMMNCGGENVYPKEVETILLQHPQVEEVCVVAVPHKVKGEAPVAWVVLRSPGAATEQEIRQFFLRRGPAYAHPRRVFFIERLPVSGTNKIDRMSLAKEARRLLPDGLDAAAP